MQGFTRQCSMCHTHRDAEELFDGDGCICLLCVRKAERKADGTQHRSARQVAPIARVNLSPAEQYRRELRRAGYLEPQIARYVAERFPD